ncbi:polysaccharide deacetylase family protein [Motilimonas pumila]|nr:polysaccharide deacetylase family protein [Motilimonas pumila]
MSGCGGGGGGNSANNTAIPYTPEVASGLQYLDRSYALLPSELIANHVYLADDEEFDLAEVEAVLAQVQQQALAPLGNKTASKNAPILIRSGVTATGDEAIYHQNGYIVVELSQAQADEAMIGSQFVKSLVLQKRHQLGFSSERLFEQLFSLALYHHTAMQLQLRIANTLPELDDSTHYQALSALNESSSVEQKRWLEGDDDLIENTGVALFSEALKHYMLDHPGSDLWSSLSVPSEDVAEYLVAEFLPREVKTQFSIRTEADGGGDYQQQAYDYTGAYYLEGFHFDKTVALTFDDGPSPGYTEQVLDILSRHQIKATFFVLGNQISMYPEMLVDIHQAGHVVANHTWDHPDSTGFTHSSDLWAEQISPTNAIIQDILGFEPLLFRPPYGSIKGEQIQYLANRGMRTINWSIDPRDWDTQNNDSEDVSNAVIQHIHAGGIILLHDATDVTVDSLEAIITDYKAQGYEFVTLGKLLGLGVAR